MSSHQYVYVMHRLSKAWPGGKEVLKNISLSFLPGAKIGVLGLNGAGKSTFLKTIGGELPEMSGTVERGEGCGVVVLKTATEADADSDSVLALISGATTAKDHGGAAASAGPGCRP